ncbi:LysR family transcriptional regulator [Alginatibacterium sediminis]|uniref:LysR family transcriptional regulator n=1 Tax=Alginatibacterium sediminis TaxID=2164068 RepID=A0A420ED41_9ALTE|nr:LysR family transcriptional regulator [Alginatibacterium sediminis]RKF18649.1 LysR family transcriptional regulator [Alginatibacterium sediminis]
MKFSLEQLQAFVYVYEQRSFSKAAIKLERHRTTVGQVIANLEDIVAVDLFERTPRWVEPTEEAHLLYHYAKQTLSQAGAFDKIALSLAYGGLESVTIAYSSFIPLGGIASIREQLALDYPNMKVNLLVRSQAEIRAGLEDETIHFAIVNTHNGSAVSNIDYTMLGDISFVPYVAKSNEIVSLPADEQYLALKESRQFILKSFLDEDMHKRVILSANYEVVDQFAMAIKLSQMDLGWTLLPKNSSSIDYIANNLIRVDCKKIESGISIPLSLWNLQSKPILEIKKSINNAINLYLKKSSADR